MAPADWEKGLDNKDRDIKNPQPKIQPGKCWELAERWAEKSRDLIHSALGPQAIYQHIVEMACEAEDIKGAALYLVCQEPDERAELRQMAVSGGITAAPPELDEKTAKIVPSIASDCEHLPIQVSNSQIGVLIITCPNGIDEQIRVWLRELTHCAGIIHEREKQSSLIKHYQRKLDVLTRLNHLVASGTALGRLSQTLAREAAFAFEAQCALVLLVHESADDFQIKGAFGFPPKTLPETIALAETQIGNVLRIGGIISILDLRLKGNSGLEFLVDAGITCVHSTSIEGRGEVLGVLLIGYHTPLYLGELESDLLEDFARGAAVAIANAKAQEQLSLYAGNLEKLIQDRTAELAVAMAHAQEANQAKSRFVANMSHEIRTPLTAIVGYASVLAEGILGDVNEQQRDALLSISRSSEHLRDLINDILDISKIEAGKETPTPRKVELQPLFDQVHKLMMQTAMSKGVKLHPAKSAESDAADLANIVLWIDPRHIRQILINLMSNAVKYTPSGGEVSLSAEVIADKVKIGVRDNGIGISKAQQAKLFDRFERGSDTYAQQQLGTGIGLSLTKHLIEINGGKIGLESEPGKGSTFWIYVPLAVQEDEGERLLTQEHKDDGLTMCRIDGLNVLVVDDNQTTCHILKSIIEAAGGKAFVANSVADARNIIKSSSLDAALLDIAMPEESGMVLLDYVRRECEGFTRHMPLIVVSACVLSEEKKEVFERGASFFIAKPFRPAEILQTIRQLTTAAVINSGSSI